MKFLKTAIERGAPLWVPKGVEEVRGYVQDFWDSPVNAKKAAAEELENPTIIDGKLRLRFNGFVDETLVAYFHGVESLYDTKIALLNVSEIVMSINTPGGFVTDGFEIVDLVQEWNLKREIKLSFLAAGAVYSMGVPIVLSGWRRYAYPNAQYLIHQVWGLAIGNSMAFEDALKVMKRMDNRIASLIARKTQWSKDEVVEIMKRDSSFGSEEALDHGLADEVLPSEEGLEEDDADPGGEKATSGKESTAGKNQREDPESSDRDAGIRDLEIFLMEGDM